MSFTYKYFDSGKPGAPLQVGSALCQILVCTYGPSLQWRPLHSSWLESHCPLRNGGAGRNSCKCCSARNTIEPFDSMATNNVQKQLWKAAECDCKSCVCTNSANWTVIGFRS